MRLNPFDVDEEPIPVSQAISDKLEEELSWIYWPITGEDLRVIIDRVVQKVYDELEVPEEQFIKAK